VEEALRAGNVRRLFLLHDYEERTKLRELADQAVALGVDIQPLDEAALTVRSGSEHHQGALAEVRPFRYSTLEEIVRYAGNQDEPPFLLILDGVEDPQNLGAVLRTADAAGVHGVLLPERRAVAVTPTVSRVSAGAVDHVKIAQVTNLSQTIEALKEKGVWLFALDMDGDVDFDAPDYNVPVAIVAGAEGKGVSRLVRERCDAVVRIPLRGKVESLNVSVATSLALYAVRRKRDAAATEES
jgi:23S rRNA (guanosine2251-2'-O)-methyltransferase